jgi:hypothetical protein
MTNATNIGQERSNISQLRNQGEFCLQTCFHLKTIDGRYLCGASLRDAAESFPLKITLPLKLYSETKHQGLSDID